MNSIGSGNNSSMRIFETLKQPAEGPVREALASVVKPGRVDEIVSDVIRQIEKVEDSGISATMMIRVARRAQDLMKSSQGDRQFLNALVSGCFSKNSGEVVKVRSYGVVPLVKEGNGMKALIVQQKNRFWSFPRGGPMLGENVFQTAERELREETGLVPDRAFKTIDPFRFTLPVSVPHFGRRLEKTITCYPAQVKGELQINREELLNSKWVPLEPVHIQKLVPADNNSLREYLYGLSRVFSQTVSKKG